MNEFLLQLAGWTLVALALAHLAFPKRFRWKEELQTLSLLNRQIFWVHGFFIALVVLMMGICCLAWPGLLVERSSLGRVMLGGWAIFWGLRLVVQWCGYSWQLWRGKRFETLMHISFTLLWTFYTLLFGWLAWGG